MNLNQRLADVLGVPPRQWSEDIHRVDLNQVDPEKRIEIVKEVLNQVSREFYSDGQQQDPYAYYERILAVPNRVLIEAILKILEVK